jgi:serine/threonine protein kinase
MLNDMVLLASLEDLAAEDSWRHVLRLQVSYFGKDEDFKGLLKWIGEDSPFFERLISIAESFTMEDPRRPFWRWDYVDEQFRDLVCRMTNLNPKSKITAREALDHPWFKQSA